KKTGGDIGLVLIRPNVNHERFRMRPLTVDEHYSRGLLCQTKIKRRNARWGGFTPNQKKILSNRTEYLALLLYEYKDAERKALMPFQWQSCARMNFKGIERML